jgi:glucose/arabinose dehydrogenase
MSMKTSSFVLCNLLLVLMVAPVAAQAPDCTGISDVSNYDGSTVSDFTGKLTTVLVASGLLRPLFVTSPPGDLERLFIVEQDGLIKILVDGTVLATPFLDVTAITLSPVDAGNNEEGLLGLAFHPDYDSNGWFFIYYTNSTGTQNVVARYTVSANPDVADAASRVEVIAVDHPNYGEQNGGMLAFSDLDGHLYIGTGDGGGVCDPDDVAQDLDSNLGKVLRLNVDSLPASTAGNPFDGATPGNDEIWSYGLHNAWRFSFDRVEGEMLLADPGEGIWEEINCQKPTSTGGENYGWRRYEGTVCPPPSPVCTHGDMCLVLNHEPPVRKYDHATGGFSCSAIGGYVYRGCMMSDLHGTYFYADWCSNMIRTFRVGADCVISATDIDRGTDLNPGGGLFISQITSFGEDERGELYVIDRAGEVFKILPTLGIMEVSGLGAPALLADDDGDWIWQDLEETTGHPIHLYKVYRSGSPNGTFACVHSDDTSAWNGGDPTTPGAGSVLYYVVTAINTIGEESRAGYRTDGAPRIVNTGSVCP